MYFLQFNVSDMPDSGTLHEQNAFDRTYITDGPVGQLQWEPEMEVIHAVTNTFVSFFFNFYYESIKVNTIYSKRFYKSQLLNVCLRQNVLVALAMATLFVGGVLWKTSAREEDSVRIHTTVLDGSRQLNLLMDVLQS